MLIIKLTKYLVEVSNFPSNGNILLFSTISGIALVLPEKILATILKENSFENLPTNYIELLKKYFLFSDEINESEILLTKLKNKKEREDIFSVVLLTTMNCNLSCLYCYQQGLFQNKDSLRHEKSEEIFQWIKEQLIRKKPEKFSLHLYGGEPLLNIRTIEPSISQLKEFCFNNGIKWNLFITTNGTLLTNENVKNLKKLGLSLAQISVDGPKDIHDQRRPYKSGSGSFNRILDNICQTVDLIKIDIRVNVDSHNFSYIPQLMDEFVEKGLQKHPNFTFNIEIVSPIMNSTPHTDKYTFLNDKKMAEISYLWDEQLKRGLPVMGHMPTEGACENMVKNAVTIDVDGNIFKCPGFVGLDDFIIGHVSQNEFFERFEQLTEIYPWKNCLDCKYAPLCQGGCRMCAYIKSGSKSYDSLYCKKKFFDLTFPKFLMCKYSKRVEKYETF